MRLTLLPLAIAASLLASPLAAKPFIFANQGDIRSMDPYALNEALTTNVLGNIYEPLVQRGKDLSLEPGLALSWEAVAPTVWRFRLRPNVSFHDGSPFTADDVVFSLARVKAEGSDFRSTLAIVAEARVVDPLTVDLVTTRPFPILPNLIANWLIMSRRWSEAIGAANPVDVRRQGEHPANRQAAGTGPFKLASRDPGTRTVLEVNPTWWGTPEHNLTRVTFLPIASDATRVAALLSGEIDMMEPVPLQDVPRIQANAGFKVLQGPELRTIFLGFDQWRDQLQGASQPGNPLKDLRVRQAIAHAIDIEAIKTRIMRGAGVPTGSMVAPGIVGFDAALNDRPAFNVDRARALLQEAGVGQGFEMGMNCPNDRYVNDEQICQAVAAMLARIGIRVRLQLDTRAVFFQKLYAREVTSFLFGWTPAALDSHNVLHAILSTPGEGGRGQFNLGRWSNPRVDELAVQVGSELDLAKRQAMISEAFKIHRDDLGHIPLHQQTLAWGMKANVQLVQRADNFMFLRWIRVE